MSWNVFLVVVVVVAALWLLLLADVFGDVSCPGPQPPAPEGCSFYCACADGSCWWELSCS